METGKTRSSLCSFQSKIHAVELPKIMRVVKHVFYYLKWQLFVYISPKIGLGLMCRQTQYKISDLLGRYQSFYCTVENFLYLLLIRYLLSYMYALVQAVLCINILVMKQESEQPLPRAELLDEQVF